MLLYSKLPFPWISVICCLSLFRISFGIRISSSSSLWNSAVNGSATSSDLAAGRLRPGAPSCSGPRYGRGLDWQSCLTAWAKIPRTAKRTTYGAHIYRGLKDVTAPYRYLSDDGLCAIDITLSIQTDLGSLGWDVTTGLGLSERAEALLRQCVVVGLGGAIRDFCRLKLLPSAFQVLRR